MEATDQVNDAETGYCLIGRAVDMTALRSDVQWLRCLSGNCDVIALSCRFDMDVCDSFVSRSIQDMQMTVTKNQSYMFTG